MRSYKQSAGQAFRHRFEGPVYRRIMMFGIRNFSHPVQRATMPFWAGIFYVLVPRARRVIEQNLERVLGSAPPLATKARSFRLFVNYAQSITNMYGAHLGQPLPGAEFIGHEHLRPLVAAKQGAIMLTGHMGYWQIAHFLLSSRHWLPPMSAGTCSRTWEVGMPSAPAITGTIVNGPWKLAHASTAGPDAVSSQFAMTE